MANDDVVRSLRDAVQFSPDNVPLRLHLAETLSGLGRHEEAEEEYRAALMRAPNDAAVSLGLAQCFHRQGKRSHALVVVEGLVKSPRPPARAFVLYARLLMEMGEIERAVAVYKQGLDEDPAVEDSDLSNRLGIGASATGAVVDGRVRESPDGDAGFVKSGVERPAIKFADVGGMDELKDEIRMKIILPLQHPEMFAAYGKPVGGGILLHGPPGCGKTHLARATAGEIEAGFLSVGISDVLDMWIGSSERNLHQIFEHARSNTPCVLFFDEVDALGGSRSDMRHSAARHLVNQFLAELDGVQYSNEGLLILAATNAPWHVDSAFRRPGRFDRILFVPPPDEPARASILSVLCRGKPTQNIDFVKLARKSDGFSGADLKAVIDRAVEAKLRDALKTGKAQPLTTDDLMNAKNSVKPSTQGWFTTARNYALYANEGGIYDDIARYLKLR